MPSPTFLVTSPQRCYSAVVERGVLAQAWQYIPAGAGKVFVVSTEDVWRHVGATLARGLAGIAFEVLHLPGGEDRKRLAFVEQLAGEMVQRGADRGSLVIACGGGIVNDMAGFLAAIFMRGIPIVQVPTTLLAQVDAAIGGKTGVNLVAGKNLIGSFHQPLAVLIDPAALDTLPEREYRAGLFEVIKYGVISSPALFQLLSERQSDVAARTPDVLDEIISESVRIKAEVVSADEREGGLRKILNFGHTVGHALEAVTKYRRYRHGEAIALGMLAAADLSVARGALADRERQALAQLIAQLGPLPAVADLSTAEALDAIRRDKKVVHGK